ncbi:FKBP-type peptidyl-prolyl cis-trans isomerase FklB [Azomonas agilis]|uniref:Peptidyl-prolyl cis-trans isomerase n=1 Tax=Azomonas agilis TaxID=116849 RepID=A0A562J093_9GAMM|nr:FKBP-type peptidyl-prolyl cis-trans isomerase [Azomonas agilis]TWH76596.1 FKBP-type peptidyl-prolyl cis-trans isomerase FklB [Azomonas agilis]
MKFQRLTPALALVGLVLAGCEQQQAGVELSTSVQKASYGIGLNMGKSMLQDGIEDLDPHAVAAGIQDALNKKKQQVSDEELMQAFTLLQAKAEERMAEQSEANLKAGQKYLEDNAKRPGVKTTASGLQYEVIKAAAEGEQPSLDDIVTVHYEGRLIDGTLFDSSIERGSPIDLPVGGVIPGWIEGLQLMHVGEKYKLYIPSKLAYGEQSPSPVIPANSVLVFELELLSIKDLKAALATDAEAPTEEVESEAKEAEAAEAPKAEAAPKTKELAPAQPKVE